MRDRGDDHRIQRWPGPGPAGRRGLAGGLSGNQRRAKLADRSRVQARLAGLRQAGPRSWDIAGRRPGALGDLVVPRHHPAARRTWPALRQPVSLGAQVPGRATAAGGGVTYAGAASAKRRRRRPGPPPAAPTALARPHPTTHWSRAARPVKRTTWTAVRSVSRDGLSSSRGCWSRRSRRPGRTGSAKPSPTYRAARIAQGSNIKTWITAIAANLARHHIRSESPAHVSCVCSSFSAGEQHHDSTRVNEHRDLVRRLGHLVAALPYNLRVAPGPCNLEEMPGADAPRAIGVPEGTLWRRLPMHASRCGSR